MASQKQHWFSKFFAPQKTIPIVPKHVAIIMDGNGRWARQRGLPRTAGHRAGMERIRDAISTCLDYGVQHLTLYAFSTENWQRPQEEVHYLMELFQEALQSEVARLNKQGVRLRFIGLKSDLKPELLASMAKSEAETAANKQLILNIALNYGGRAEITAAVRGIARQVKLGAIDPNNITELDLAKHLFTNDQPDPDLLIRPGGESRISNFLIWQIAYAELYFSQKFWPDFGREELVTAFNFFAGRERRFGRVKGGDSAQ